MSHIGRPSPSDPLWVALRAIQRALDEKTEEAVEACVLAVREYRESVERKGAPDSARDAVVAAATNCPPCPKCGCNVATPSSETEHGRWYGPPESRLWCPACGAGWYGSDDEVKAAQRAMDMYELACQAGWM